VLIRSFLAEDGSSVGSLPAAKLKEYCASGDAVCQNHTGSISSAHLSYGSGSDPTSAAQFIITTTGAK